MDNVISLLVASQGTIAAGYTKPGWYYWDESYHLCGPYEDEEEARNLFTKYVEMLGE